MKPSRVVKLENEVALALYRSIDTPVSLSCHLLLEAGQIADLISREVNPIDYNDAHAFALDYQAVSLLKKTQRDIGIDRKSAALDSYLAAESLCKDTNDRLFSPSYISSLCPHSRSLLDATKTWIRVFLGKLSRRKLDFAYDHMAYGKGSTINVKGRDLSYTRKYEYRSVSTTRELLSFGIFAKPPGLNVEAYDLVDYTTLSFVPKNAKTDRTIEVQPDLNIFYQRGVGALLRERLLWSGFPVNDQTVNQELARKGSLGNGLVTLDLSSASDTLSIGAVKYLLPNEWFELLEFGRTERIKIDDSVVNLEKFSAMGNGYTWELETLIFNAILFAATGGSLDTNAYGDDMIYPSWAHSDVLTLLDLLGFQVNVRKTYWQTYFRESCGADFFNGVSVRPAFLKRDESYDTISEVCYTYGNSIRRWAYRLGSNNGAIRIGLSAWLRCFSACPRVDRHIVPLGTNGGFEGDLSECYGAWTPIGNGWSGTHFTYKLPATKPVSDCTSANHPGWLTATLAGVSNDTGLGCENKPTGRYMTRIGYTLVWPIYRWCGSAAYSVE